VETIDTIITNFERLSADHIDWSPSGGMLWLTSFMVIGLVFVTILVVHDARQTRRQVRLALYREAEHAGYVRGLKRSFHGFQETV